MVTGNRPAVECVATLDLAGRSGDKQELGGANGTHDRRLTDNLAAMPDVTCFHGVRAAAMNRVVGIAGRSITSELVWHELCGLRCTREIAAP